MICRRVILIRTELYEDPAQRRYLTAHALGHHFLHQGNFLSLRTPFEWWAATKKELEADRFAALLLCPASARPHDVELCEAAELFGVPPDLVLKREALGW